MLPEERLRLYGIATRFPRKLNTEVRLKELQPGVYETQRGTDTVRMIVLSEIAAGKHNAIWRLFSAKPEVVLDAWKLYSVRQAAMSTIVKQLLETYRMEKINMPYTVEDFQRDYVRDHLDLLSPDEILKRFSADDRLRDLPPEDRLRDLPIEDRLRDLSPEDRLRNLSMHDIVDHMPTEDLKRLMEELDKKLKSGQ